MRRYSLAYMMGGCCLLALSTPAMAQDLPADEEVAEVAEQSDTLVITGSRIMRSGYQAPTPVTVVGTEALSQGAPSNIAEGLKQLPQFNGGAGQTGASNPTASLFLTNINPPTTGNYMDLRGLGPQRMLILLDGRRVPPTSFAGTVDTNVIPQALVQRVDIVTAGASAVYGADAVSGVANFVLDTKFTGVKGLVQGGTSEYGDSDNIRLSLAAGMPFAGGRGHVLLSAEYFNDTGVKHRYDRPYLNDPTEPFFLGGQGTAANPYKIVHGVRNVQYTPGGFITAVQNAAGANNPAGAALVNTQFLSDKITGPFTFGQSIGNSGARLGGDGSVGTPAGTGAASLRTKQAFGHLRYDFTDSITGFVQGTIAQSENRFIGNWDSRGGSAALTVYSGNAYLPTAIQDLMTQTGTASFTFNRQLLDLPGYDSYNDNTSYSVTAGFEGGLGLFGTDWKWEAYYTHGQGKIYSSQVQNENRHLFASLDAVVDPSSGDIVCRVTLTNPGFLPGCVPGNFFGAGNLSAAATDFISGVSEYRVVNKLDEIAGNITGSPFSTWAGPVSINLGASYRYQSLVQTSNADPAVPTNFGDIRGVSGNRARFGFTNTGVAQGNYSATEAYAETVVPLLADKPFAKTLEVNAAGRYTNYSTSGAVWTWKAGLSYQPFEGLRFRATRSKDIRAPTLYDLFAGRDLGLVSFFDAGVTNLTRINTQYTGGNPNLKPEVSYTTSFGVVVQPAAIPGFSASVDYYKVKISDAISNISSSAAHNECVASAGASPLCALFDRPLGNLSTSPDNFPRSFFSTSVNVASLETEGVDVEMTYRRNLSEISESLPGRISLRALVGYVPKYATNAGAGARTLDAAGVAGRSKWKGTVSVNYDVGDLGVFVQGRVIGAAKRDTPENTGFIYVENDIKAQAYVDLSLTYNVEAGSVRFKPFFTINNLLNQEAPLIPTTFIPNVYVPTLSAYDYIGRRYTVGLRFSF